MNGRRGLVCLLALLLASCKGPTEPDWGAVVQRANAAEQKWTDSRPVRYFATEQRLCSCPVESAGPVRIYVGRGGRGEVVDSLVYAGSGATVPAPYASGFYTADGLFDVIRDAAAAKVFDLQVEFDPALGYPRRIYIDYDDRSIDDEIVYLLSGVQAY